MIWFFERKGQYVRCETRKADDGGYELAIIDADGVETVERFSDSASLAKRQVQLEKTLADEGWNGPHGRIY